MQESQGLMQDPKKERRGRGKEEGREEEGREKGRRQTGYKGL